LLSSNAAFRIVPANDRGHHHHRHGAPEGPTPEVVLASFCTINTMTDDQGDMLLPWRQINKQAARIAMIVGFSAAAAMLAAATLPLWSGHGSVRTVLIGGDYRGTQPVWVWNFAATDAWWAVGLVFFVPFMATVSGAVAAKRSLSAAAKNTPQASNSSFGPALTERQRSAQSRKRQGKLAAEQQRFAEQNRSRLSVWSSLGATFAFLVGGGSSSVSRWKRPGQRQQPLAPGSAPVLVDSVRMPDPLGSHLRTQGPPSPFLFWD
jgi:hypothetical protein